MSFTGKIYKNPNLVTWTNFNQTGSTASYATAGNDKVSSLFSFSGSGNKAFLQYTSAPATPYSAIFCIVHNVGNITLSSYISGYVNWKVGFFDGTKAETLDIYCPQGACAGTAGYSKIDSTGNNGSFGGINTGYCTSGTVNWVSVRDDGTNINFYIATDAKCFTRPKHWVLFYSTARLSWLANVNYICWGTHSFGGINAGLTHLTLKSFEIVGI